MTCLGISDQFLYPVQQFVLKNDTQKNGTSRIGLLMEVPPPSEYSMAKAKIQEKILGQMDFLKNRLKKNNFKNLSGSGQISRHC